MKQLVKLIIFTLYSTIFSQDIIISGTVLDKSGMPVINVKVDLVEKNTTTQTDSLGNFIFNQTSIINIDSKNYINNVVYNSNSGILKFNCTKREEKATVRFYNAHGKMIQNKIIRDVALGENLITLFSGKQFGNGFYIIKFEYGNYSKVFKANHLISNKNSGLLTSKRFDAQRGSFTLNFTKDGFKDHQVAISSTDDVNLGNIIMWQYPKAEIANVSEDQSLSFGDSIKIQVNASDPDGEELKVTFIIDSVTYITDTVAPFEYTWNSLRGNIGKIPITVIVEDSDSLKESDSINISLNFETERVYGYEVVNKYNHDNTSYTQGLVHADGIFYEGSGLYGKSVLRKVEVETGNVLKNINLGSQYFGEGITIWNDTILQLTWRENVIFKYDKETFTSFGTVYNPHDGWGITHDNKDLILSDGSSYLYFWNPHTISQFDSVRVYDKNGALSNLNELEYFYKKVFANIYQTRKIAIINHKSGDVLGKIDFTGLADFSDPQAEVLNGIAYDPIDDRIFITGKHWSNLYEVKLKLHN